MIGKTIGKYRIVGQLGRGGMGTVYKAVDETLDREVAIKVLNAELADTEMMKRFRTEATILGKLNHPGIATIHEFFQSDTDFLMVVEFVRGETLEKVSDCLGPMPPERVAYLIDKILSALEHAHHAGIVHRDMKPANVMVTEHGGVKIMDFGVARVRGAEHMTADGSLMGTPAYMPPEQVLGQEVDGRADLYSVGVVFYRLLTAALPFKADTAIDMLKKQVTDTPMPLHVHRQGLPDWCETIVQRALAKSPAARFQTAEEFREALGRATGMVTWTELAKALSISVADLGMTPPPQPGVLERFGPTPMRGIAAPTPVVGEPNPAVSTGSAPDTRGTPLAASSGHRSPRNAETVRIERHPALKGLWLAILAGGATALTIVALWRPGATRITTTADTTPQAAQNTVPSTSAAPDGSSQVPVEGQPVTPAAATNGAASTQALTVTPAAAGARPGASPASTSTAPGAARGSTPTTTDLTATSSARTAPVRSASKTFAVPFAFEARVLVSDDDRQRERACQVVLTESTINVRPSDEDDLLRTVPYDTVLSISYSRGRHPLWNAPAGPTPVVRAGRSVLGIFRGARHWVSLRTTNANDQFVVLRLGNESQAKRAISALEERTGRTAEVVETDDDN